jgi:hypothetical protein
MGRSVIHAVSLAIAGAAVAVSLNAQPRPLRAPLTVHEWGTFTSVAGPEGEAVQWLPQAGSQDLPCFVEHTAGVVKGFLGGTVRMETPVLYFYASQPLDVAVGVRFRQGSITEWYPHATVTASGSGATPDGTITWPRVSVVPDATDAFRRERGASHYYMARETNAAPLRVGAQPEKFLFYRGVGQFQPALRALARDDGSVALAARHGAIGDVILFENRRGAMTFSAHHLEAAAARLPRPDLDDASGAPLAELKRMLVANGLYDREAQAMVDTWKDSWFEEGSRLLYIVARAEVDEILPLTIEPTPSNVARVFVGRVELATPATLRDVTAAMTSNDATALAKYGRFLRPFAERAGLVSRLAPVSPPGLPSCQ